MRKLLARLAGKHRPRTIAIFGTTPAEVECAILHARTGAPDLPIQAWCAEEIKPGCVTRLIERECARFSSGRPALSALNDLHGAWPALTLVAWTGKRGSFAFKLLPFLLPPFRVVVFNEAGGFFAARPASIAKHAKWRLNVACRTKSQLAADWLGGALQWIGSFAFRTGERLVDVINLTRSFFWRAGERIADGFNWAWESFLAVLAVPAQWMAPVSLAAVGRVRRPAHAAIASESSGNDICADVLIPNRGWPRRAVMAAALRSDAEFIVLRKRGEHDGAASLIALARKSDAFAVAKQSAHAAWRKQVVTKHPFRALQKDEVAEVFAPWSTLVVLRRQPLLLVGIPRALTFGGALMILFWKSAAAGLRTVTAGHRGPVPDESAMALEDAEFAVRLTISPRLSALRPNRPSRFRGNVAWSPFHRTVLRGKVRVLVVSPYLPFPLSHGGAVRIYNLCRALASRVDFVLASFREAGERVCYEELHEVFREVYVVDADEKHSDPAVPKQIAEYRNSAMADLIRGLCLERRVDVVQLEYTQMAEYRDHTGAVPVILVEHDITFTLYRQLADFNADPHMADEYQRWLEFERAALQCSNFVWTMSDGDRAVALNHGAARNRTRAIPNGVDLKRFKQEPRPPGPPTVLFIGSFRHLPNLLAYEALRTSIMPRVWKDCPNAVLHIIAGPQHERAAELAGKANLLLPHPRIVIEGFVEDVRPVYRSADVVAVPLPLSAGTNIKLLEAMACGRAIVSTRAGCQGLDLESGRELLVADTEPEFADAVLGLLDNSDLRRSLEYAARRTAESRFGWDAIAEDALECYAALARDAQFPARARALPDKDVSAQHA